MAGDTRYCGNCRRDIAVANYIIHSVHCERNLQLCTICDEPVPRSEMELHLEDSHKIDVCELCNIGFEKWLMEKHKGTCHKRLVPCEFCELEYRFDELDEHKDVCGTRTEKCTFCSAYVKLKDKKKHRRACQQERQSKLLSVCDHCSEEIPANIFHKHVCRPKTKKCSDCDDLVLLRDQNIDECQNAHECKSPSKSAGKCLICQEMVPWVDLREHESACRLAMYSSDDNEEKPKFSAIPMHQKRQRNDHQLDLRSQQRTSETPNIRKLKQCPFCKERYPDLIIKDHLEMCLERPFTCELCLKTMLLKDKLSHETQGCKMIYGKGEEFSGNEESYSAVASGYTSSYDKKLKQCSFCNKKFPEIMFQDHLHICEERPYQCSLCLRMMPFKNKFNHHQKECVDQVSGSSGTACKDVPVYKKTFEKGYLENNFQMCPYCHSRIPDAKIAGHVQCCSEGKTTCKFCGIQIAKEQEAFHLQRCIEARDDVEKTEFETSAGGKKNKKKKKKGMQNEPVQQKSWLPSFLSGRKSSSHEKEFVSQTYFQPETVQLPCEFCGELFPDLLLIEHQSGCRPDLVSFPSQQKESHSEDHRASPDKDLTNYRDAKSTGAFPKRRAFQQEDPQAERREYSCNQTLLREPIMDRDYFNYPSGVPDCSMQSKVDVIKPVKKLFPAKEEMHDNKVSCEEEKKSFTKNTATPLFNFNSSSRKKPFNPLYPHLSIYSSPPRKGHADAQNTEFKAVGAERAERKEIIQMPKHTSIDLGNLSDEAPGEHDTNYELNSQCEKCCLKKGNENANYPETWDTREDDAKNEETFGSNFNPRNNLSLPHNVDDLSDSGEQFYDAEENLKISNVESADGSSFMDNNNLDVFLKYLMKDEAIDCNDNSDNKQLRKRLDCNCENEICYCDIINQLDAAENNNAEGFEGIRHLQNFSEETSENIPAESMRLKACSNTNSANNSQFEETCVSVEENSVNTAEVEKDPPNWYKWRSNKVYHSDSE